MPATLLRMAGEPKHVEVVEESISEQPDEFPLFPVNPEDDEEDSDDDSDDGGFRVLETKPKNSTVLTPGYAKLKLSYPEAQWNKSEITDPWEEPEIDPWKKKKVE